jgi:hypothetical protein
MKYLRQYEEAGWESKLKKILGLKDTLEPSGLAKQSTKEPKEEPKEQKNWEDNITSSGSNAPKILLDYLNKQTDKLEDIKEVTRKENGRYSGMYFICITAKLKIPYLQTINNNNNLFNNNIKDCTIRFEIHPSYNKKSVKIHWYIDVDIIKGWAYNMMFNSPIQSLNSVTASNKNLEANGVVLSLEDNNIESSLHNILNIIPYFFSVTNGKIISYNLKVKKQEEERKIQEELRKKREERINIFKGYMEDVQDYLIDLEDMSEGKVEKSFNDSASIDHPTMFFKFKIDGIEKSNHGTFTVNQRIIDIFRSLNSARERIQRKIPDSKVTIEFGRNNIVCIYVELIDKESNKGIGLTIPRGYEENGRIGYEDDDDEDFEDEDFEDEDFEDEDFEDEDFEDDEDDDWEN